MQRVTRSQESVDSGPNLEGTRRPCEPRAMDSVTKSALPNQLLESMQACNTRMGEQLSPYAAARLRPRVGGSQGCAAYGELGMDGIPSQRWSARVGLKVKCPWRDRWTRAPADSPTGMWAQTCQGVPGPCRME
jgi:hypothetical protein